MKIYSIYKLPYKIFFIIYYKLLLGNFGFKSIINKPLKLDGKPNIYIGNNVRINYKTWLAAMPLTGSKTCKLIIKDGTILGHFNHIYATKSIIIEEDVLTADKVYISDNLHGYENITIPVHKQPIKQNGNGVIIGAGSWLGENVCVIGASIGKHCVIGANSVVTKNVPDYCVAVGIPARIIKRYCVKRNLWIKTDNKGNFLE